MDVGNTLNGSIFIASSKLIGMQSWRLITVADILSFPFQLEPSPDTGRHANGDRAAD